MAAETHSGLMQQACAHTGADFGFTDSRRQSRDGDLVGTEHLDRPKALNVGPSMSSARGRTRSSAARSPTTPGDVRAG